MAQRGLHIGCHVLVVKFGLLPNVANAQGGVNKELLDTTSRIGGLSICIAVAKMCNVIWFLIDSLFSMILRLPLLPRSFFASLLPFYQRLCTFVQTVARRQ